jgi:hypothetical protein
MVDSRVRRAVGAMRTAAGKRTGTGALLAAALFLAGASPAPSAGATPVLEADAFVRAEGADDFAPTKGGAAVAPSSSVRTAPGVSSGLTIAEGVSVRMAPSTTFGIRSTSWLPPEHPGASPVRAFQVQLSEGEIDLEAHDPTGALGILVMLPGGRSVALWRGSGNVAIHGDDVAVALYDGMAIAGAGQKWRPLLPRTGVILGAKTVSATHAVPDAPAWIEGARASTPPFAVVRGDERAIVGGDWVPVTDAASYRVEVGADAHLTGAIATSKSDAASMKTDPLAPGAYFARVRVVAADGIEGAPSTVKALRVARLSLPPLAVSAPGGAVVLAAAQAVTLDDPRDLEVATASDYDPKALPRWIPASSELTLGGAAKRTLLIRHASSHVQTKLLLVRRQLHAHVSFNPPRPVWPQTPVDIVVKVEDPTGYLDPSLEPLAIDVHVDLDRPDLAWKHTGDTWTARVEPMAPPGPWVVRVGVQDRAGVAIGASLIDVDQVDGPGIVQAKYAPGDAQVMK